MCLMNTVELLQNRENLCWLVTRPGVFYFYFYFILFYFFFLVYIFTEYQIDFVEELQKSDFLLVEHKLSEVYEKFWDCIDCTQPDCCFVFRSDQNKDKK